MKNFVFKNRITTIIGALFAAFAVVGPQIGLTPEVIGAVQSLLITLGLIAAKDGNQTGVEK